MDSTLGILFTGYPYFLNTFRRQKTDVIHTRLLLNKITCIKGEEAARIFYDPERFMRKGATPKRFRKTLFGMRGVQGLDGAKHKNRKALFMQCMSPDSVDHLNRIFVKNWQKEVSAWVNSEGIELFDETEKILARSACEWVGVPLKDEEFATRKRHLSNMIDASGGIGLRYLLGRLARILSEDWIANLVEALRDQKIQVAEGTILKSFSLYRNFDGKLLDKEVVAVEILNLLRPIVAIARYFVFASLALHDQPHYKKKLKENSGNFDLHFVQEVRRFYPFFPFVAALVRQSFHWNGHYFPKGRRVLLDLYATNHDEKIWEDPDRFYPERFDGRTENAFNFIPQGGGDHDSHHRCAGEWITLALTRTFLNLLVNAIDFTVPDQDLHVNMARIPAIPKSRFVIKDVQRIHRPVVAG